jgi:hypothetical protein
MKNLEIFPGSLQYDPNAAYEFVIQTTHLGKLFYQSIRVIIENFDIVPIVSFGCRFPKTCLPSPTYLKINPSAMLIIDGRCVEGCLQTNIIQYTFTVYSDAYGDSTWSIYTDPSFQILGEETNELTLSSSLFLTNPSIALWKVELRVTINQAVSGVSSIILKPNRLPYNGNCYVDKLSGISLSDFFNIICQNWIDPDGTIITYEYFGKLI